MRCVTLLVLLASCYVPHDGPCQDCAADPFPRCISSESCAVDNDCARGLTCHHGSCRVISDRVPGSGMLREQFGLLQRMYVALDASGTVVNWAQPNSRSREVHCSLFTCLPYVESHDGVLQIDNYEKCAYRETGIMLAPQDEFSLVDPLRLRQPSQLDHSDCRGAFPVTRPFVSDLLVGCLAYSESGLLAVSDLVSVDPRKLEAEIEGIPDGRACTRDHDPCVGAEFTNNDGFGTCLGGHCRARCGTPDDCAALSPSFAWDCVFKATDPAWQHIGACVERVP
jgi:hypothetical protein